MARLLENQAAQLLKETSTMSAGDVEGFSAVAFPIVRRVFGQLLAQDLVSVQPMSLPSGLIFFLDFTFGSENSDNGATDNGDRLAQRFGTSLYGGGKVGAQLTGGVDLADNNGQLSAYTLNNGYSSPTASVVVSDGAVTIVASGTYGDTQTRPGGSLFTILRADPAFISGTTTYLVGTVEKQTNQNMDDLVAMTVLSGTAAGGLVRDGFQVRRLTDFSGSSETTLNMVFASTATTDQLSASVNVTTGLTFPIVDVFNAGGAIGSVVGATPWGLENNPRIPEIDIKVDSVAVTAISKKLKAKWSPELAQDLNAYHNLDAEVELTSILSEQVALEIDQEILEDLVKGSTAGTLYWSRSPGKFLNRETGALLNGTTYPDFTGTVSEWYETLLETVNEVSARIHRKTLRGGANFLVCSPEVANILEFTSGFRASVSPDDQDGSWGVHNVGSISRKMDIHVDPYFPRGE
jgi:hypothetical protein